MVGSRALIIGDLKRCNECSEWKPFETFGRGRACCKACHRSYNRAWSEANPDKVEKYYATQKTKSVAIAARAKKFRETIEGKAKSLCLAASQRSRKSGLELSLSWHIVFVMLHLQDFKCAQTGISFEFSTQGTHRKLRKLTAPSIDRKDNDKGYTIGNIQIVCWFYNAAKGTSTDNQIWQLFDTMQKRVK